MCKLFISRSIKGSLVKLERILSLFSSASRSRDYIQISLSLNKGLPNGTLYCVARRWKWWGCQKVGFLALSLVKTLLENYRCVLYEESFSFTQKDEMGFATFPLQQLYMVPGPSDQTMHGHALIPTLPTHHKKRQQTKFS